MFYAFCSIWRHDRDRDNYDRCTLMESIVYSGETEEEVTAKIAEKRAQFEVHGLRKDQWDEDYETLSVIAFFEAELKRMIVCDSNQSIDWKYDAEQSETQFDDTIQKYQTWQGLGVSHNV